MATSQSKVALVKAEGGKEIYEIKRKEEKRKMLLKLRWCGCRGDSC